MAWFVGRTLRSWCSWRSQREVVRREQGKEGRGKQQHTYVELVWPQAIFTSLGVLSVSLFTVPILSELRNSTAPPL